MTKGGRNVQDSYSFRPVTSHPSNEWYHDPSYSYPGSQPANVQPTSASRTDDASNPSYARGYDYPTYTIHSHSSPIKSDTYASTYSPGYYSNSETELGRKLDHMNYLLGQIVKQNNELLRRAQHYPEQSQMVTTPSNGGSVIVRM